MVLKPLAPKVLLVTLLAYLVTATCSTAAFGTTTPIWYSNAILLVPLLLRPMRVWPAYLVPAWLIGAAVNHRFDAGNGMLLALTDMFEVAAAATLVRLGGGLRTPIFGPGQVARVTAACVAVPLASAALAASVLARDGTVDFQAAWRAWYLGDMLGLVTGTLFILSWTDPALRPIGWRRPSWRRDAPLVLGVLLCGYLVQNDVHAVLVFLTFPLVFAITWRFGLLGATLAMASVTLCVLWVTTRGQGAMAELLGPAVLDVRMEAAQVYLASILLSTLPLTVLRANQRQLTQNLRRAGDARTEFLAAMSHEIRTPMTGVLGLVDLLASETLTRRQKGYVDAMRLSGGHLLSIINDILDFSRIESGKLELEEASFRVADVLEQVRSFTHPLAVESGLQLREEILCGPDEVLRGDELRIRQVLLNLVSNAIKFTDHGEVVVRVLARPAREPDCTWLRFEVRDTGAGIPEEKLKLLFSPFTQADQSIARRHGGSGLGLAISRRLVEAMGGSISATSTAGGGSTFAFEVPLRAGEQVVVDRRAAPVHVPALRILAAEDVQLNRQILRTVLSKDGHAITFAGDGAQAVRLVQAHRFDLVLMDVQMPVMDGVEATRSIRAMGGRFATLPIIGLTANVMARERERYMAAGMDDCLAKPIDWQVLRQALARHAGDAGALSVPAPPAQAPARDGLAVIDEGMLGQLRAIASEEELAQLLRVGIGSCEKALAALQAEGASPQTIAFHAHKVKGASGQIGMPVVSRLAGALEMAAASGQADARQIGQLGEAFGVARAELERRSLLVQP